MSHAVCLPGDLPGAVCWRGGGVFWPANLPKGSRLVGMGVTGGGAQWDIDTKHCSTVNAFISAYVFVRLGKRIGMLKSTDTGNVMLLSSS